MRVIMIQARANFIAADLVLESASRDWSLLVETGALVPSAWLISFSDGVSRPGALA